MNDHGIYVDAFYWWWNARLQSTAFRYCVSMHGFYFDLFGNFHSVMGPHGKELSLDLKQTIISLHQDKQGYKKIAKTLKLSKNTVC